MKRTTMMETLEHCIDKLEEILQWESQYSDAGLLINHSITELGRAALFISRDEKRALEEELTGHTRQVERQIRIRRSGKRR